MKLDRTSETAYRVALSRAAHQILDTPTVLHDPIALKMVGADGVALIRAGGRQFESGFARRLRAFLAARSRFAEDELAAAIKRGVRQYVILGAGLDTFAYRNPHQSVPLEIFEVDYPTTQASKQARLAAAGISVPDALRFVPVDFEAQTLAGQLRLAGFRADEPAFFSWLGVSMYLTPEIVMATMKFVVSSSAGGGGIVFDYITPFATQRFSMRLRLRLLALRLAAAGEPWKSFFDPDGLRGQLEQIGFTHVTDMGPDSINARYYGGRTDMLGVAGPLHLMHGRA
jgi:methyltransferase (TIGR00027 family)